MMTPRLSVVLTAYNEAAHIKQAIDSILVQTFTDFELIIINDGSADETPKILATYKDPRLRIINHPKNKGLVYSLNEGIRLAKGEYIARQDGDDWSEPTRLEKQLKLFESNPKLVLAGTSMHTLDTNGKYLHDHMVLLNEPEIKQELLVRPPFPHGSVVFKKDAFDKAGGYKQSEWPAEDYGLWLRMASFGDFGNVDEPLYAYRENATGISLTNAKKQTEHTDQIRRKAWDQRHSLLPKKIQTGEYLQLRMGHFRLERIAKNLLFCLATAIKSGDVRTALKTLRPIFNNNLLARKCARLVLLSLKTNDD